VVTYEGVGNKLKGKKGIESITSIKRIKEILKKYKIKKPFLLYVGSVYPHKNIERLIEAVEILNQSLTTNHPARIVTQSVAGGQSLILFDDVWTTGATLKEAAKVLKRNGAKFVHALAIAR
ncbi:MAG: hypothetical protein AAB694_01875, partial [Patescibacteria group bacterium]